MNAATESTSVIANLIQVLKDGEEGFSRAAESVKEPDLKSLFTGYAVDRAAMERELSALASVDPEDEKPSLTGTLHRGWINLKSALTAGNDHAILAECERGEDHAVDAYRKALEGELPADVRTVVESQATRILAVHNQVKALRDSAKAAQG